MNGELPREPEFMVTRPIENNPERTHDAVLLHLKRRGEMTVGDLCEVLAITSMAVRRHLVGLQKEGLITSRIVKKQRGRPTNKYSLAAKAQSLFPSGYQNLANDLLDAVYEKSGAQGVMELLEVRNKKIVQQLKSELDGKAIGEKIAAVAKVFSEGGFMTDWEALPDGNFLIYQRHCAVHDLAKQYRQLCGLEPRLIEQILGVKVTRQQYMLNNDPVCGYLVESSSSSTR